MSRSVSCIIAFIIIVNFIQCKEDDPYKDYRVFNLERETKLFANFDIGSRWIYRIDELDLYDTIDVIDYTETFFNDNNFKEKREFIEIKITSSYVESIVDTTYEFVYFFTSVGKIDAGKWVLKYPRKGASGMHYSDEIIYVSSRDSSDDHGLVLEFKRSLEELIVSDSIYKDVIEFHSDAYNPITNIFWNSNIGPINFIRNDELTWNLVSYELIPIK
ncbi:hypothetical protein GYB29_10630 [bacterium]|nr:hypothetical protein [bacterium]